ncbi:uncharacterized protein LOC132066206 [Lycium ferocissimum]|uniref:uncharacterized protein LOC132066206 n=1 Tax=Lycium ferocissimum TaxID=112874 RepID=UPI0028154899|nr:uncharacterized protein LOC132066206 [Lycium ferocissimum]
MEKYSPKQSEQHISSIGASAASVIQKILLQHTGNVLGLHFISKAHKLAQSDVDPCAIFVSNHGIKKLTLDMDYNESYVLPNRIFTCGTLTHLKLSRCVFKLPDGTQFPNLISLQLEHSIIAGHRSDDALNLPLDTLNLPMLETLELRFCANVDSVNLVSPKLENMSILSSFTITFQCFNVNPIFTIIKHLCLNGTSLEKLGLVRVPDKLHRPLKLQSLKICDFKISVESISCAFCLLGNSPNLDEIEIDDVVKVDETLSQTTKLLSYLSKEQSHVNEALRMIRTVKLRKFKGSSFSPPLTKQSMAKKLKVRSNWKFGREFEQKERKILHSEDMSPTDIKREQSGRSWEDIISNLPSDVVYVMQ